MAARSFRCRRMSVLGDVYYRLSWVVDRYYKNSRLRYPKVYNRDTDEKGARKFCRRHGIEFPAPPTGGEK